MIDIYTNQNTRNKPPIWFQAWPPLSVMAGLEPAIYPPPVACHRTGYEPQRRDSPLRKQKEGFNADSHSAAVGRNQTRTPNLALAPRGHRGDETNRPAPRDVGNQASKFFSTEEQGEHGGHGEGQYGASRGVRSGLARSAKFLLLRVLARPPCSSVLKTCFFALDRQPEPSIGGYRPANANRAASREATHDERSWRKPPQINVVSAFSRKIPAARGDF